MIFSALPKRFVQQISRLLPFFCLITPLTGFSFTVSTGTQWSTEAAIEVLKKGGNATDAMVAATFMLNVTQGYNIGIGGGGFYLANFKGKTYFWDHREQAPSSAKPEMFLQENGQPIPYYPERVTGPNPVGIPGTVLGLYTAHNKLGKLPWKTLLAPAIERAEKGFPVTDKYHAMLLEEWDRIKNFPETNAIYGDGFGQPKKPGSLIRNPMLAETLRRLANEGAMSFYTGKLAADWVKQAQAQGVKITLEDLKNYHVRETKPIEYNAFGNKFVTAAPPSAGGLMVGGSIRFLDHFYRTHQYSHDSAERVIVTSETLAYFQKLRNQNIGDQGHFKLDPQKFYNSEDEKKAWREIEGNIQAHLDNITTKITQRSLLESLTGPRLRTAENSGHTAHLSIIDDHGMAVSYTSTIEELFGSGITVRGFGFLLNNELSDFDATPGTPNAPLAGKRPRSNMSPTIVFNAKNELLGTIGCAGGPMIPTTIVEVLENYYISKLDLRHSLAHFRFHPETEKLDLESRAPESVAKRLRDAGYTVAHEPIYSTAQAILRRNSKEKFEVAAEPRGDSLGISF